MYFHKKNTSFLLYFYSVSSCFFSDHFLLRMNVSGMFCHSGLWEVVWEKRSINTITNFFLYLFLHFTKHSSCFSFNFLFNSFNFCFFFLLFLTFQFDSQYFHFFHVTSGFFLCFLLLCVLIY